MPLRVWRKSADFFFVCFFFFQNGKAQKRKKLLPVPEAKSPRTESSQIRRSSRHRRMRGEKEVTVSSTDTLRDLKLQVWTLLTLYTCLPSDLLIMVSVSIWFDSRNNDHIRQVTFDEGDNDAFIVDTTVK